MANDDEILPEGFYSSEFKCFFYLPYFPTRFSVSDGLNNNRHVVYDFKDGKTGHTIGDAISEDITHYNLSGNKNDWWLCIIPASSEEKTRIRFQSFCNSFCSKSNINNGYNLLSNSISRTEKHLAEDRNSVNVLGSINFGNVSGKKILLFDDVYTTGKTFKLIARKLIQLGALEVKGLFLAKTHWLEE